jgi:hypothetical protein
METQGSASFPTLATHGIMERQTEDCGQRRQQPKQDSPIAAFGTAADLTVGPLPESSLISSQKGVQNSVGFRFRIQRVQTRLPERRWTKDGACS